MKLMTEELRKLFPLLYENENKEPTETAVIVKFFNPFGSGTWYATEFDGEDIMYGLANIFEPELGYFSLQEMEEVRVGPGGVLGLERDLYIGEISLAEAMRRENYPVA